MSNIELNNEKEKNICDINKMIRDQKDVFNERRDLIYKINNNHSSMTCKKRKN